MIWGDRLCPLPGLVSLDRSLLYRIKNKNLAQLEPTFKLPLFISEIHCIFAVALQIKGKDTIYGVKERMCIQDALPEKLYMIYRILKCLHFQLRGIHLMEIILLKYEWNCSSIC